MVLVKRSSVLVHHPLVVMAEAGTRVVIITGRIAKAVAAGRAATTMAVVGRRSLGRITVKVVAEVVGRIIITAVVAVGKTAMVMVTAEAGIKAAIMEAVGTKVETTLVATAVAV